MARRPRLACADFTFPLLPHEQSLDLVATLGFKGVDIGLFQGRSHLQPASEFATLKRNARRLKRKLDEREGFAPSQHPLSLRTGPAAGAAADGPRLDAATQSLDAALAN